MRLLTFGLATFNVCGLVLFLVVLDFRAGAAETFGDSSLGLGLLLLAVLWVTTYVCTGKATRSVLKFYTGRMFSAAVLCRGAWWGGVNGAAFWLCLILPITPPVLVKMAIEEAWGEFLYMAIVAMPATIVTGSLAAFVIGGLVGLVFTAFDAAIFTLARHVVPQAAARWPAEPTSSESPVTDGADS